MIKCCIFDLDGTLLNTLSTIKYYINLTLEKFDESPIGEEECKSFVGDGARKLAERVMHSRGVEDTEEISRFLCEYTAAYDKDPYHLTSAYGGVDELIRALGEQGVKLAVLSNKPDFATRATIDRFFGGKFDAVYGARESIPLKPCPDALLGIMSELGVKASECAYVGDSEVDVKTGKAAGVAINVSALWGFRTKEQLAAAGAEAFADFPLDILTILQ